MVPFISCRGLSHKKRSWSCSLLGFLCKYKYSKGHSWGWWVEVTTLLLTLENCWLQFNLCFNHDQCRLSYHSFIKCMVVSGSFIPRDELSFALWWFHTRIMYVGNLGMVWDWKLSLLLPPDVVTAVHLKNYWFLQMSSNLWWPSRDLLAEESCRDHLHKCGYMKECFPLGAS